MSIDEIKKLQETKQQSMKDKLSQSTTVEVQVCLHNAGKYASSSCVH